MEMIEKSRVIGKRNQTKQKSVTAILYIFQHNAMKKQLIVCIYKCKLQEATSAQMLELQRYNETI